MANELKLDRQIVGNVGLFYCCYQLSRMGWNALPTSRNAKGVDIIAYRPDSPEDMISIQVKTLSNKADVPLGTQPVKILGDYWIVLNNVNNGKPIVAYILDRGFVEKNVWDEKGTKNLYSWLCAEDYAKDQFKDKWEMIKSREK